MLQLTSWPTDRPWIQMLPFTGYDTVGDRGLFGPLVGLLTLADLGMALWILLGRWPGLLLGRLGGVASWRRVEVALVAVMVGLTAKTLVWVNAGYSGFGVLAFAWYDLVVVLPVCGVAVLGLARRQPVPLAVQGIAWGSLAMVPVAFLATQVEPHRLVVERTEVPLRPGRDSGSPIRVAVLADLQTDRVGDHERAAIDLLLAEEPDLIVIPGDLFQGNSKALLECERELRELLARLQAPGGVFLVPGDVDDPYVLRLLLHGTGITVLENEIVRTQVGDQPVTVAGLSTWSSSGAHEMLHELEHAPGPDDVRLLIAHHGRHVRDLPENSRVDLVIAGHTHGGQVVIPGLGPPLTLSPLPRQVAAGGLHTVGGRRLYISRGVGHERGYAPRLRWFCPPEVSLLTLR